MPSTAIRHAIFGVTLSICLAPIALAGYPDPGAPEMQADATLNDVMFINPDRGWAVGDRGVIWHTRDGGRHWELQASPAECRLESVFFLDAQNGWIAGGYTHPLTHKSSGIVLRTRDGGGRWEETRDASLPLLKKVKFFDARQGWAAGLSSSLYRSGIFTTRDGGRSWSPIPGDAPAGYLAADFHSPETGAAAGYRGTLSHIRRNGIQPSRTPFLGPRPLYDLTLNGPTGGWLVGAGGLLLTTRDGGLTWQAPPGPLPAEITNRFDFHAVESRGDQAWAAGAPGTRIMHTTDGGSTWQPRPLPTTATIHAIDFVDDHHGWAVGALGTILATADGGGTWQVQQSGGRRAAILVIASRTDAIPWEVLVKYAGNEGMLTAVEVVGRDEFDARTLTETVAAERLRDATNSVGGTASSQMWRFPLRPPELDLDRRKVAALWDQVNDGRARDRLEETLVRKIRTWRPTVLLVPSPQADGDPDRLLVSQAALSAVEKAADSTQYVEQLTTCGLQPWRVGKTCAAIENARLGHYQLQTASLASRLGASLREGSHAARALLATEPVGSPAAVGLLRLTRDASAASGDRDLFDQLPTPAVGEARRRLSQASAGAIEQMTRWAQRQARVERLLDDGYQNQQRLETMLGQLSDLTQGLSADGGSQVLHQLARRLEADGKLSSAAQVYELIAAEHVDHPAHAAAVVWLCQYYGSSELAWNDRAQTRYTIQQVDFKAAAGESGGDAVIASRAAPLGEEGTASAVDSAGQAQRAVALGERARRQQPALYADPRLRFPLAAAQRRAAGARSSDAFFHRTADRLGDAWQRSAAAELWLTQPTPQPPKPVVHCRTSGEKPYLDGQLDDTCWQSAKPMPLYDSMLGDAAAIPEGTQPKTEARVSYDDDFLYLAVRCRRLAPRVEINPEEAVERDSDLSGQDRVELLIDVDRDYSTYFRLQVDQRGMIADDCWGDAAWDPQGFVATGGDRGTWTAEAAIAWKSLAVRPPRPGSAWAANVQRIVPGDSLHSWSQPASVAGRGEGFGLLLFDE